MHTYLKLPATRSGDCFGCVGVGVVEDYVAIL